MCNLYATLLQQWAYARERVGYTADLRRAAGALASIAQRTGNERVRLAGLRAEALWRSNYSLDQCACAELRLELHDAYTRLGEPFVALECLADAADSPGRLRFRFLRNQGFHTYFLNLMLDRLSIACAGNWTPAPYR